MEPSMQQIVPLDVTGNNEDIPWVDSDQQVLVNIDSDEEKEKGDSLAEPRQPRDLLDPSALSRYKRRNSISLPAGLENLDSLEIAHQVNEKQFDDSAASSSDSEASLSERDVLGGSASEDDTLTVKVPIPRVRKKSVMPPRLRLNGNEFPESLESGTHGCDSPANSVTSVNSISSLLKEKLMSFPGILRRKRPREYKLKAFVAILFLCIVFLVGFAYIFYHQQVLQRAYFERIRFNKADRGLKIYNAEGNEVISGVLGLNLAGKAYKCLPRDRRNDGSVCLEWMGLARLYLKYTKFLSSDVRCYQISWYSLYSEYKPTDCYDWSHGKGHWYGGGAATDGSWPLELGKVRFSPFITGDLPQHEWSNVLQRYFINSRGVAIIIDDNTPLYLSINTTYPDKFCMQARHDDFPNFYHTHSLPQLNYSLCATSNMKLIHGFLAENSLWDGIKEEDIQTIKSLLSEPVWQVYSSSSDKLTENSITNLTEDIIALGYPAGHVLINEMWQITQGDYELDTQRFPTFKDTIDIIHRRGFRIVLSAHPYISTESHNFKETVKQNLLVHERGSDTTPALTRYKGILSAGIIDITKNQSAVWLQEKLLKVQNEYMIDAYYFELGTGYEMPQYYQFHKELTNPDEYKTAFVENMKTALTIIGVSSAIKRPQPPVFVSLPVFYSSWESLKTIVPTVLTYGLIGYPFIMPGPIGGEHNDDNYLPDKELYIRWLQLSTFLPVMQFRYLPNEYGNDVEKMARSLLEMRNTLINPLLYDGLRESLDNGLPLIRPLWMLEPFDTAAQTVDDEFCVCDKIIVAPVLNKNSIEREIYLPAGVWRDGIDGSLRKGHRWIHHYRVPIDKVAYFVKMPNNTRF